LIKTQDASCRIVFFFFSSRRRHTRFSRDWSSDVCSSDLLVFRYGGSILICENGNFLLDGYTFVAAVSSVEATLPVSVYEPTSSRSEERRVGKECRFRWWSVRQSKN